MLSESNQLYQSLNLYSITKNKQRATTRKSNKIYKTIVLRCWIIGNTGTQIR